MGAGAGTETETVSTLSWAMVVRTLFCVIIVTWGIMVTVITSDLVVGVGINIFEELKEYRKNVVLLCVVLLLVVVENIMVRVEVTQLVEGALRDVVVGVGVGRVPPGQVPLTRG
jgi:hypothetical protein